MIAVLAVAAGAFLGAPARFFLDRWFTGRFARVSQSFPVGLTVINIAGSALAGIVLAVTDGTVRTFLLVGLCGAFTTFSGFGWQALQLWRTARTGFWLAVLVMTLGSVFAFWLTFSLAAR